MPTKQEYISVNGKCKSAAAYWTKRVKDERGRGFYTSTTPQFNKRKLTTKLKLFEKELSKHNINFIVRPWDQSFESPTYGIVHIVKKQAKSKSFIFTTENLIYTASIDDGYVSMGGIAASAEDAGHIANAVYMIFHDMVQGRMNPDGKLLEIYPKGNLAIGIYMEKNKETSK